MIKEFLITEDGSHTLYLPEIDEHYHSTFGAIQESQHVYIDQGLLSCSKKELNILEIGFGTGLNAYLTYGNKSKFARINYYTLEKFPLSGKEFARLNYPEFVFPENADIFRLLHNSDWDKQTNLSADFYLYKLKADLLQFDFTKLPKIDLVYYDAFAPVKQPEMWTDQILKKVANCVSPGGIWVTYCAKGTVRRSLEQSGFMMERVPGPKGKKEILRGKKTI